MSDRPGRSADLAMCGYPMARDTAIPLGIPIVGEDRRRRYTPAQVPATDTQIAQALVDAGRTGRTI